MPLLQAMAAQKKIQSQRAQGEDYPEPKTERLNLGLSPVGKRGLDAKAAALSISRSELVEQLGRLEISAADLFALLKPVYLQRLSCCALPPQED